MVPDDTTSFVRVSDDSSAVDPNPINADTLSGKTIDDFALKTDLSSLATKTDLNIKAPLASPKFTGTPKATANTNYTTA